MLKDELYRGFDSYVMDPCQNFSDIVGACFGVSEFLCTGLLALFPGFINFQEQRWSGIGDCLSFGVPSTDLYGK